MPRITLTKTICRKLFAEWEPAIIYRSLKMKSEAENPDTGYIYERGDSIETESLTVAKKEEFSELTEFVKSKLNN